MTSSSSLSQLFNQRIFRVPDYQRGYAWGGKQLTELWDDIDEISLHDDKYHKHYTGTIYLEQSQPEESEKWLSGVTFYSVVDGQQRLTSLSILLYELLSATEIGYCDERLDDQKTTYIHKSNASGASKVYRFSYFQNDKNHKYLLKKIFEDDKVIFEDTGYNQYTKNLNYAKEFFKKKIADLNHAEREVIFLKLTTALQFDVRTIEKDLDVQAVFETMNNRGKPLSTLEKLKNRLMHLTEKLQDSSDDKKALRVQINQAWGKIYTNLAISPDNIQDEDTFLSAHLSLIRIPKDAVFSEKHAEIKVFEMFCNKSQNYYVLENGTKESPVSYEKIQNYILNLSEFAPYWSRVHISKDRLLHRILLLNSGKELKILLASFLQRVNHEQEVLKFFTNIEGILFRNRIPGLGVMDERTFAGWARGFYNHEETVSMLLDRTEIILNSEVTVSSLISSFQGLFNYERGPKGFHRWTTLKYFLFEYEEFLRVSFNESNEKVKLEDFGITTIEHILPQHFWDHWIVEVNNLDIYLEENWIDQGRKVLINTLGNLTILKNAKNSSLSHLGWSSKQNRYQTGSYNEIAISRQKTWGKVEIFKRGIEMLNFMQSKIKGLHLSSSDMETMLLFSSEVIEAFKSESIPMPIPDASTS
jgi:uncharacterized protein with ParB-like and HNH nuclease domain